MRPAVALSKMSREEREVSEGKTVFSNFVFFAAFARRPL
jgi:hypothetical protein